MVDVVCHDCVGGEYVSGLTGEEEVGSVDIGVVLEVAHGKVVV